jgi:hypothetical protein
LTRYVLLALFYLVRSDAMMRRGGVKSLHSFLKALPTSDEPAPDISTDRLCDAIDRACIFYYKPVLCLQRSSATVMLLRRYGFEAQLVVGARVLPFKSHAWVELGRVVLNDKPYVLEMYRELERC